MFHATFLVQGRISLTIGPDQINYCDYVPGCGRNWFVMSLLSRMNIAAVRRRIGLKLREALALFVGGGLTWRPRTYLLARRQQDLRRNGAQAGSKNRSLRLSHLSARATGKSVARSEYCRELPTVLIVAH